MMTSMEAYHFQKSLWERMDHIAATLDKISKRLDHAFGTTDMDEFRARFAKGEPPMTRTDDDPR